MTSAGVARGLPARVVLRARTAADGATFAVPAGVVLFCAAAVAWQDRGSIAAADFGPWELLTALVLVAVLLAGVAKALPRDAAVAGTLLLALAVWAGVSGLWAPIPSLARDEALLELFGLLAFATALVTLRRARDKLAALAVLGGGLALVALGAAAQLHGSTDLNDVFRYRRLSFPITYANAVAAFFLVGFWPSVVLAGRRASVWPRRALAGGCAALLLAASLLAQSKGAVIGLVLSTVVVACVSPARLRLLLGALLAAAPVAAAFAPLTRAYSASGAAAVADVHRAATTTLVVALAGAALTTAWALADRRVRLSDVRRRLVGRIVLGLTVLAVLAGAAGFVAATHHPQAWLSRHWQTFKHPDRGGSTHLVELGSNRYDFWRVAAHEFAAHPLAGGGARSFGPEYLLHGRSGETPARAHSLPLELLGEDGAIGFVLAVGGLGTILVGLARRARARSAAANAALGGCVLVLGQACVDWTFTFPAITVPFFLLAGLGLADEGRPTLARRPARVGAGICLAAAVLLVVPVWLSGRLLRTGLATRNASDLRWAHRLDPFSVDPLVAEAQIAPSTAAALPPLLAARARAPRSVQVRYVLGSVLFNAGRRREALREFERAAALDPRDATVRQALAVVRRAVGG